MWQGAMRMQQLTKKTWSCLSWAAWRYPSLALCPTQATCTLSTKDLVGSITTVCRLNYIFCNFIFLTDLFTGSQLWVVKMLCQSCASVAPVSALYVLCQCLWRDLNRCGKHLRAKQTMLCFQNHWNNQILIREPDLFKVIYPRPSVIHKHNQ